MRWCTEHNLALFAVRRADVECFRLELEAKGKAALRDEPWGVIAITSSD